MISPVDFSKRLHELGFETAVGVPDSTFKGLISYFSTQALFRTPQENRDAFITYFQQ